MSESDEFGFVPLSVPAESAFPSSFKETNGALWFSHGMSLRDYFAAQSLQGFVMAHSIANGPTMSFEQVAKASYDIADALLKERSKP